MFAAQLCQQSPVRLLVQGQGISESAGFAIATARLLMQLSVSGWSGPTFSSNGFAPARGA